MTIIITLQQIANPALFVGPPVVEETRCCCRADSSSSGSSGSSSGGSSSASSASSSGGTTSSMPDSSVYSSQIYEDLPPEADAELLPFPLTAFSEDSTARPAASDSGWLLDPETGVSRRVVFMQFPSGDEARKAITRLVTAL